MKLYRAVSETEYADILANGLQLGKSGEKFFTTDPGYLQRVLGNDRCGKRVYRSSVRSVCLVWDIPDERLTALLRVKRSPGMPLSYRRLATWHEKAFIQVKYERGCLNLGFFAQSTLDAVFSGISQLLL